MARIAGIEIPNNKRVVISLTYIYGIGLTSSQAILKKAKVLESIRVKNLEENQLNSIKKIISESYQIEGDLRSMLSLNLKRLSDTKTYRGMRHKMGLPVRGQNTQTNTRTRKGKRRSIAGKKSSSAK